METRVEKISMYKRLYNIIFKLQKFIFNQLYNESVSKRAL